VLKFLAAHTLFVHGLWACKSGEDIATIKIKIYLLIKSLFFVGGEISVPDK
jgi:hypothetical protein